MFKILLKNLKTTLIGATAGGAILADGIRKSEPLKIIAGAAIALLGLFSKDNDDLPPGIGVQ